MTELKKTHGVRTPETSMNAMQSTLGASLAAACFAGSFAGAAQAQEEPIVLPTVEVETTAVPTRSAAPARPARAPAPQVCTPEFAGTPVCAAQEAEEARLKAEAEAKALADAKAAAGSSQYADPDAPFKANSYGNSRLQGDAKTSTRTVTAITQEVLETTGTTSVREIARSTPGISLGFGEGGNSYGDNLYIRGFKANNDIYKDGVRDPGVSITETFATEQVEIAKGPSGTVGGRGTTGGALDIVSKSAQDVDFSRYVTTVTSADTVRQTIDINRKLDDTLALRFNGMVQEGNTAGRNNVHDNRRGAALALKYTPNEQLTVEADLNYTKFDQMPDWGIPYVNDEELGLVGPVSEFGVDPATHYGVYGRDFQIYEQTSGTFKTAYAFDNGFTLTNTLRRSSSVLDYVVSVPSGMDTAGSSDPNDWLVHLSTKSVYQETDVLADVLELNGDAEIGGMKHSFVLGASYTDEKVRKWGYENLESEDYEAPDGVRGCETSLVNPDPVGEGCWTGETPTLSANSTNTDVRTLSAYLLDTVDVTDRLTLNAGVRIDHYEIDRSGIDRRSEEPYAYERTDTMFNWNLGATYALTDKLNVYAAAATSTNPMGQEIASGGGFYGGLDEAGTDLAPEKNTSLELGAKFEFTPNLLLTAALFQTTKENARETIGRGSDAVTTDTLKYAVRGLELGVAGQVSEKLALFGGATLMQSEILSSAEAENVGESVANFAHEQFNLLATYQVTDALMLGGRINYKGETDLGSTAANGLTIPSSLTLDLLGEYEFSENQSIKFGVTNVADATVYDAGYRSGEPFTYVGPGREFSISLDMKF